jgi:hypothetical protein
VSDPKGRTQTEAFENGMLEGIFGPKKEEEVERRKL